MNLAGAVQGLTGSQRWAVVREVALDTTVHHAQGLAKVDDRLWISSVDNSTRTGLLFVADLDGHVLDRIEVGDRTSFHAGGICVDGHDVWVPSAPYRDVGPTLVQRVSAIDGSVDTAFVADHHIGALCVVGDELVTAGWASRTLRRWTVTGELLGERRNPSHLLDWQDLQLLEPGLIACGGRIRLSTLPSAEDLWVGGIALLSFPNLEIVLEVPFPGYSRSGLPATAEGFVLDEADGELELIVLPDGELGPITTWRLER